MKKILITIAAIIVLGVIGYKVYNFSVQNRNFQPLKSGDLKFRIVHMENNKPIANAHLTICTSNVMFDLSPEQINKTYCEMVKDIKGTENAQITTATDSEGIFYLNKASLSTTVGDYSVEINKPFYYKSSRIIFVGANTVRILNEEKNGHVVSNKYYDLTTKQVKEVFTNKNTLDKNYPYETIDLIVQ